MKADSKYKASIKLSAIGDALGWITEFEKDSSSLEKKYNIKNIQTFLLWEKNVGGRFVGFKDKILPGSYSDDTQLMLSVARCINKDGTVDNHRFGKVELSNWLLYARGGGKTVKTAAEKIKRKSINWYDNYFTYKGKEDIIDYRDAGANGAAMRVLPIALANFGDFEKIKEQVFFNSIITHGHPRAIVGALLYSYSINLILQFNQDNFIPEKFIEEIGVDLKSKFSLNFQNSNTFELWVTQWNKNRKSDFTTIYNEVLDECLDYLRTIYKGILNTSNDKEILEKLGCFAKETKGSGISTVIAGLFIAAKYFQSPKSAILVSVNSFGSDTDSIAAFTGGLIGALCGQNIIPSKWKNVQDYEYLDRIGDILLAISEDRVINDKELINTPRYKTKNLKDFGIGNFQDGDSVFFEPIGDGVIEHFEKRKTLTKYKYNILASVRFDIGQTCIFHKLATED